MKIYLSDIRPLADETLSQRAGELLTKERRERAARCRNAADRWRSLGAGLLLEYGLRERGASLLTENHGYDTVWVERGAYGKPYIKDRKNLGFNLSHSGDYVVAVFAEYPAGIDIERVRRPRPAMVERCFSSEEREVLRSRADVEIAFTELWTRKESYSKAVGEGLHLPLADFSVLGEQIGEYQLYTFLADAIGLPEGYILSVCAAGPVETVIQTIEIETMIDRMGKGRISYV